MTLEELALAIEADLPQPDPAFAEEMDALVEAGFPRRERRRLPRPRLLALGGGLAAAATAAVVAVVALGGQHQAPKSVATSPPPRPQAASGPFVQPPSANAQAPLRQAPSLQSLLQPSAGLQGGARHVERSADVTLAAPDDRLEEGAGGVVAVAR